MPSTRWTRSLQLALIPIVLLVLALWSQPSLPDHMPNRQQLSDYFRRPFANHDSILSAEESPLLTPGKTALELEEGNKTIIPQHLVKSNPAFHLVVTDAKKSPALCRTLLSAAVLDYPPPTLIDYSDDSESDEKKTKDIKGLDIFLQNKASDFQDHDVMLVVDGRSTFFQLPSSVLLHRWEAARSFSQGSTHDSHSQYTEHSNLTEPSFSQKVLMSASETCALGWPSTACRDIPESPVRVGQHKTVSGPNHADAGLTLGLVPDVKRLIMAASKDLAASNADDKKDGQAILAKLFGEQELSRRSGSSRSNSWASGWRTWMARKPWSSGSSISAAAASGSDYGMALDYSASLFMTPGGAAASLKSILYNDVNASHTSSPNFNHHARLPIDLATAPQPFRPALNEPSAIISNFSSIPFNASLDNLPTHLTWHSLPLLTNPNTHSIPAVLHLPHASGDSKDTPDPSATWTELWFHKHARSLLRNYIRSAEGPAAVHRASVGGDSELDTRGGKGGVWTADGSWLEFSEVCAGFEEEVFGDGLGRWAQEGGPAPRCNINGQLISGEGDCAKIKDEERKRKFEEMFGRRFGEDKADE